MDRLIALLGLRVKTELRALSHTRERLIGALLALPGLLLGSLLMSFFAYAGLRALRASSPELLMTVVAGAASVFGLLWALSPLLAGVAFAESHDMSRLLHFPIPLPQLVLSSLLANLLQPMTLTQLPLLLAAALGVSRAPQHAPGALLGLLLSFALVLLGAQTAGLLLLGLARNRRLQDVALFVALGAGFLVSALPLLLLAGGSGALHGLLALLRPLAWTPFAWGARAAVHAGRGEALPALGLGAAAALALLALVGVSAALIARVYRGELDLGTAGRASAARARMPLQGSLGALLEKDLRSAWRDPGTRATLLLGLLGPALVLFLLSRSRMAAQGGAVMFLASYVGASAFGSNALGFERRGLGLLLLFPIPRWRVLLGKNLAALLLRLPGLLTLGLALLLAAPLQLAPAALTVAVATFLIAVGVDNFFSILFPIAAPAPGKNPYAQASGGRGLGTALLSWVFLIGALLLSAPFALLAWLPLLLGEPRLWLLALPLSLAGAVAVYAMLVGGAARLLERREPDVLERVLGEA